MLSAPEGISNTAPHVEAVMLHQVESDPGCPGGLLNTSTAPEALRGYLEERKDWQKTTVEDLLEAAAGNVTQRGFILTFDDGYKDFRTTALPLLEAYEARALLFVTTAFVDGNAFPYELQLARWICEHEQAEVPGRTSVQMATPEEKRAVYKELREPLKPKSTAQRTEALRKLADLNGWTAEQEPTEDFLSWDDLRRLDAHPLVTIGGHSHTHPVLSAIGPGELLREVRTCKQRLEQELGHRVDWFSYPYGAHSMIARGAVAWSGFRYAMAGALRPFVNGRKDGRLRLPRLVFPSV